MLAMRTKLVSAIYSVSTQKVSMQNSMQNLREFAIHVPMTGIMLTFWEKWPRSRIANLLAGSCARGRKPCGFASGGVQSSQSSAFGYGFPARGALAMRLSIRLNALDAPAKPGLCGAKNASK
jgi:hypothetical protein